MPFKSEKQRKWMWANDPEMAKKWEKKEKKMKKETKVREIIRRMVREIMSEGFAGGLKKESDRKKFDSDRRKNAEVLGYTLTGTDDLRAKIGDATIKEQSKPPAPRRQGAAGGSRAIDTKMDIDKNPFDEGPGLDQDDAEIEEAGRTAGTETSQAAPPKSSKEKQAVKIYGAYIAYTLDSSNSEYTHKDQRNKLALVMLKDKFKVPSKLKSKLKNKKYHDKFTDYKSIVWEGKFTEAKRESTMDIIKRIVDNHQNEKIQGVRVDATTANAVLKVYNALSPKHQRTMEKLPIKKLVTIVWRLIK
tara:strand:- start:201 stop:1109 length:909 start_codon:yes stop_codon:yes gene_type:complete